jgi:hypothetical protein
VFKNNIVSSTPRSSPFPDFPFPDFPVFFPGFPDSPIPDFFGEKTGILTIVIKIA